jgi:tRNA uridine 5-carboxymethylaminomethyl modification enzyme
MRDKLSLCHSGRTEAEPTLADCHPERSEAQPNEVEGPCVPTIDFSSALGQPLAQLLKRPEVGIEQLAEILRELDPKFFATEEIRENPCESVAGISSSIRNDLKSVETEIKYAGYLSQQQRAIDRLKKSEQRNIPDWFDYKSVSGLSREMQEKLLKIRPRTLGHASRIPGVTPAAVSLVNVYIEIQAKRRDQATGL